jgi:hypothetical protein
MGLVLVDGQSVDHLLSTAKLMVSSLAQLIKADSGHRLLNSWKKWVKIHVDPVAWHRLAVLN